MKTGIQKTGWLKIARFAVVAAAIGGMEGAVAEESAPGDAILALERDVQRLRHEVDALRTAESDAWTDRFRLGGYGEMHANIVEGGSDKVDLHRLVLYVGYEFSDAIEFHSEIEIEHAHVDKDSGGYLIVEQAFMDLALHPAATLRIGRILTPLGMINARHEPTTFYGVERPTFDRLILPSTWMSDGIGLVGRLTPVWSYEAYVVGGLDGSGFSGRNGIRDGRVREQPSLNEPAVTGRLDARPTTEGLLPFDTRLRFGLSAYYGGLDNGNRGEDPGIDGAIGIYSADAEASVGKFDFRGAIAYIDIDGAEAIGNETAEVILGWMAEVGVRVMPESWKRGRLRQSELALSVRYDDIDTQHRMPGDVERNPDYRRDEWTFAVTFLPVPQVALKADYQIRRSRGETDPDNLINFGLGWVF